MSRYLPLRDSNSVPAVDVRALTSRYTARPHRRNSRNAPSYQRCGHRSTPAPAQRRYQRVCRRVRPAERDPVDLTGQLSNFRTPLDQAADQHFLRHSPAPAPAADRPDRQRRLGPDDIGRLVAGYNAGATAKDLAAEYGIHRRTVAAHLERAGVLRRRQGLVDPAKVREAGELYEQGWSTDRLAAHYRLSQHSVNVALRQAGITIRPPGGSPSPTNRGRPSQRSPQ